MHKLYLTLLITTLISIGCPALYPLERPTPYAPDYSPECELLVPGHKNSDEENLPLSAGLQYIGNYVPSIKRSTYHPGGQVCISYDDINRAVAEAQATLGGYVPPEIHELSSDFPKPPHISVAAEILQKATLLLAKWYGLSKEAIIFGLPRIDTYKTAVRDICPTFLKPVKCELSKYRTLTGMCNNLDYPSWGSARSAMIRFLPPDYGDGIAQPKRAKDGGALPIPRLVSFVLHQDISEHDHHITYLTIAWGQMIDHDLTLAATPMDDQNMNIECCQYPPEEQHPNCYPIDIPHDDPFYKFFRRQCMDFVRSMSGLKPNCPLGPRSQQNAISSYIDANFIYGSTQEVSSRLREFSGGRLKTAGLYRELGMKDLLPMKTHEPEVGCERIGRPHNLYCFDAGDERVNEQLQLTVIHTVWMREHNRIADILHQLNPHWDDETLFQETRRIVAAVIAHINFNEFLPIVVGRKNMETFGLDLVTHGYYEGYDPKINPGIRTAFQSGAFRFGHSILPDVTERYNKFHEKLEAIRLSSLLRQPYELYKPGIIDSFIMGLANQEAYRMDSEITTEVTNHLFEKPGERFGLDLAAMNVQRAREMGVPGYNAYREYCGFPKAKSFYDLSGVFSNKTLQRFISLYRDVDDIDLWSAGISEYPLPGALLGPVFSCIIADQFSHVRRGDRFWYENAGWPSQFSLEQLNEIRKAKLARLLCDNADDISTIQLYPMLMADPTTNPRVNCHELPFIDLSYWRDTQYLSDPYRRAKA